MCVCPACTKAVADQLQTYCLLESREDLNSQPDSEYVTFEPNSPLTGGFCQVPFNSDCYDWRPCRDARAGRPLSVHSQSQFKQKFSLRFTESGFSQTAWSNCMGDGDSRKSGQLFLYIMPSWRLSCKWTVVKGPAHALHTFCVYHCTYIHDPYIHCVTLGHATGQLSPLASRLFLSPVSNLQLQELLEPADFANHPSR